MVAINRDLELEMECLARAKRVVVHRSPGLDPYHGIAYFVCDHSDFVLFPMRHLAESRGATAEETHKWLSTNLPDNLRSRR